MSNDARINVTLLGQNFNLVQDDNNPEQINEAIRRVSAAIDEITASGTQNPLRVGLLVAINMANELISKENEEAMLKRDIAQRANSLMKIVDNLSK